MTETADVSVINRTPVDMDKPEKLDTEAIRAVQAFGRAISRNADWLDEPENYEVEIKISLVRRDKEVAPKKNKQCVNWPHNHAANGCG